MTNTYKLSSLTCGEVWKFPRPATGSFAHFDVALVDCRQEGRPGAGFGGSLRRRSVSDERMWCSFLNRFGSGPEPNMGIGEKPQTPPEHSGPGSRLEI